MIISAAIQYGGLLITGSHHDSIENEIFYIAREFFGAKADGYDIYKERPSLYSKIFGRKSPVKYVKYVIYKERPNLYMKIFGKKIHGMIHVKEEVPLDEYKREKAFKAFLNGMSEDAKIFINENGEPLDKHQAYLEAKKCGQLLKTDPDELLASTYITFTPEQYNLAKTFEIREISPKFKIPEKKNTTPPPCL